MTFEYSRGKRSLTVAALIGVRLFIRRRRCIFGMYANVRYNMYMVVPITQFRKDIFSLTEAALKGTVVEFTHKGVRFKVVPDKPTDKVSNITPLQVINPDYSLESAAIELQTEMEKEWEKDWSEL